jgi:hypothetical protein
MNRESQAAQHMDSLARLVIGEYCGDSQGSAQSPHLKDSLRDIRYLRDLSGPELASYLALANNHHVVMRALSALEEDATRQDDKRIGEWCRQSLAAERARIGVAIDFLQSICTALESNGCRVAVIKSLDHWPDLGSDLDLCIVADHRSVDQVMRNEFGAHPVQRSWGDRLARKWNYGVPGLPELVEIHVQCLGQTGEHAELARRVIDRGVPKTVGEHVFRVPAPEERIIICALQRVYRHFYFRLCDMVDTASLLQIGTIDFAELQRASSAAGIWRGVATFLSLVNNYVTSYGGIIALPHEVATAANSPETHVRFENGFLRVPLSKALSLYVSQLLQAGRRRDARALRRLPLLPPLAVSALVAHRLTGDDKGIW